jgi:hypothetical protein
MAFPVAYPSAPLWFKVKPGTVNYNDEVPHEFYVKGYICTGVPLSSLCHSTFFCPHTPEFHGLVWPVKVDEDHAYVVPSLSDYTMSSVSYGYISANNLALSIQEKLQEDTNLAHGKDVAPDGEGGQVAPSGTADEGEGVEGQGSALHLAGEGDCNEGQGSYGVTEGGGGADGADGDRCACTCGVPG